MNYPTDTWQELLWDPKRSAPDFFNFCANVTNIDAPANITAVDWVLANYTGGQPWTNLGNYATYFKKNFLSLCPGGDYNSVDCFGTQSGENPEKEKGLGLMCSRIILGSAWEQWRTLIPLLKYVFLQARTSS